MNKNLKRLIALILVVGTVNIGGVCASAAVSDVDVDNTIEDIYVESNKDLMNLVDMDSFKVSKTEAKPGDVVKISFKLKEKIDFGFIQFIRPISGKTEMADISYNAETDLYEGKIEVTDRSECGQWKMTRMYLKTEAGVEGDIFDKNRVLTTSGVDFSVVDFNVSGTKMTCKEDLDLQAPNIDISSLSIDKTEVNLGDEVKVSLKAEDESGISRIGVMYKAPIGLLSVDLKYNEAKDKYEGTIKANQSGTYKIHSIHAIDIDGNANLILNKEGEPEAEKAVDLSSANIVVKDNGDVKNPEETKFPEIKLPVGDVIDISKLPVVEMPSLKLPEQSIDPEAEKRLETLKNLISQKENPKPNIIKLSPEEQEKIKDTILKNASNPNKVNPMSSEELKKAMEDFKKGNN